MVDITPLYVFVRYLYNWFFNLSFSIAGNTFYIKDLVIFILMSTILLFIIKNVFGLAGKVGGNE